MSIVAVIGANGQLGREVVRAGEAVDWTMVKVGHTEDMDYKLDISSYEQCQDVLFDIMRDVGPMAAVVNTAAYHNLPDCKKNPRAAWATNVDGVVNIAKILGNRSSQEDTILCQISTDYVFGGDGRKLYSEGDTRVPFMYGNDDGVYGVTKMVGEIAVETLAHRWAIVRISTLFGEGGCRAKGGGNLIDMIMKQAAEKKKLTMSDNSLISITYAPSAANAIIRTISEMDIMMDHKRVVHACNDCGFGLTHYEVAKEVLNIAGLVEMRDYELINEASPSPRKSALLPTYEMVNWKKALRHYMRQKGYEYRV